MTIDQRLEAPDEPRVSSAAARRRRRWTDGRLWAAVSVVLLLWVLVFTPLGRGLDWDEATFFGQAGVIDGIGARIPPPWMAASREVGTALFLDWLRNVTWTLASTQLIWTVLSVALTLGAFYEAGRWTGPRGALVGAGLYLTWWLSTALAGTFYGSFIGAAAALATMALYLRLRHDPARRQLVNGVLLGLAVALLLAMRNLESAIVLLVIGAHALLWRPRDTLRRWQGLAVSIATFSLVFVLPWTLDTIDQWGGVLERYRLARSQGHPFGVHNGIPEWSQVLFGVKPHFPITSPNSGALLWLYVGLTVLLIVVVAAFLASRIARPRRSDVGETAAHLGLIGVLAATSLGLFLFFSQDVRERYLAFGLVFACLLAGHALVWLYQVARPRVGAWPLRAAGATAVALWLIVQALTLNSVQEARVVSAGRTERLGGFMATVAAGRPCVALGPASKPQVRITSGCRVGGGRGVLQRGRVDSLAEALTANRFAYAEVVFVVWDAKQSNVAAAMQRWEEREGREWMHYEAPRGYSYLPGAGHVLSVLVRDDPDRLQSAP